MIELGRPTYKYYLQLFGRPCISEESPKELQFSTRRALQLLAILAVNPDHSFSRIELGRTLWPDDFDDSNRIKFRQELLRLTSTLGEAQEILIRDKAHLQLSSERCHSDIAELRLLCAQLKKAPENSENIHREILSITEREFLEGKSDPWIETQRERFAAIRTRSLSELKGSYVPASLVDFQLSENLYDSSGSDQETELIPTSAKAKISLPELVSPVFCGREADMQELKGLLLNGSRLVTILGPGGIGKTRISQELCNEARDWFGNRTWFVNLADHTNGDFIVPEVLTTLGLPAEPSIEAIETIRHAMSQEDGPCLMVLDNLEQFPDCGAAAISRLLQTNTQLTILVTSRKPVLICHEHQYPLKPLDTDDENSSAALMFVELARMVKRSFQPTLEDMAAIKEIVSILEGVPLSISLAASRINATNLETLRDSLQTKIVSLVTHNRDVSGRHQTLRACIDWSYGLLPDHFRKPFARLAVFAGGWFEESAQRVIGCTYCSDLMEELESSSLITSNMVSGVKHYNMLECIREYAYEKLEREEIDQLKLAHFEAQNDFCRELWVQVRGKGQQDWISRAEAEADNIREALLWSVDFQPDRSVEFLTNQMGFWWGSSRYGEGIKLLEHVQRNCKTKEDASWARLCWNVGAIFAAQGEYKRSLEYLLTGLHIFQKEENPNPNGMASCLYNLAELYKRAGEYENSLATCRENLKWVDPTNLRDVTYPQSALVDCLINLGRVREARKIIDEMLSRAEDPGDPVCQILPYEGSAMLGIETCDLVRAEAAICEAEKILAGIETPRVQASVAFNKGLVLQKLGNFGEAAETFRVSRELFTRIGDRLSKADAEMSIAECIYGSEPVEAMDMILSAYSSYETARMIHGQIKSCTKLICMTHDEMNPLRVLQRIDTLQYLAGESGVLQNPAEQRALSAVRLACAKKLPTYDPSLEGFRIQRMTLGELFNECRPATSQVAQTLML